MQQQVDYIIVGLGLAGIALCERLIQNQKSFVVFDNNSQQSSLVAAGLYNPVVLKRFTEVWKAKEQLALALPMYKHIEDKLDITIDYKLHILRRLASVEEQNQWFTATDQPTLAPFMKTQLITKPIRGIDAPFHFGEVLQAGRLNTKTLISAYRTYLKQNNQLISETFSHEALKHQPHQVQYKVITAQQIVFTEGYGLKSNPFFDYLPLNGTKGEVLTVKIPDLALDVAIKSAVFLIPLGNDLYKVGATYKWKDKTNTPTTAAKEELCNKLERFLTCPYEVVDHQAGIRPTVTDRRPLVGRHPEYKNYYVLNGLGSRGVMIAPYVAQQLYDFIHQSKPLDPVIDINRF